MIKIYKRAKDDYEAHSVEAYPHECCGVLVGTTKGDKVVTRAVRVENKNAERAADRYDLDPADMNRIDKEARGRGEEVIGIYHSHPDHPDRPSDFDRDRGFPYYSYVIVSVMKGEVATVKCWYFEEDDEPFGEEAMTFISE